MKRRLLSAVTLALVAVGFSAAPALAHTPPPEHNHVLTVPGNGQVVQVGPHVCGSPQLHGAFHDFHTNVHISAQGGPSPWTISAILC